MKHPFWKWSGISAIIGIFVAVAFFLAGRLFGLDYPVFRLSEILWPSSIFLLATDGSENTIGSYLIVATAIVANGIVYSLAGAILWLMRRAMIARKG
jgi:hypothetical protein